MRPQRLHQLLRPLPPLRLLIRPPLPRLLLRPPHRLLLRLPRLRQPLLHLRLRRQPPLKLQLRPLLLRLLRPFKDVSCLCRVTIRNMSGLRMLRRGSNKLSKERP